MVEPWDEVVTLQRERQLLASAVQAIKTACERDHGKAHVSQCPECWMRIVNRMRDRYLHSASKEWFTGRRAFLQDLDTLFSKAHAREIDFKTIEQRISDEKKEWYRDKVRTLGLHHAAKTPAEARALQQKLNDRTLTADQLATELRSTFGDGAVDNSTTFAAFLERLKAAQSPKARADAYLDVFFRASHDPAGADKGKKYTDMVANGTSMADAINTMLRDRQAAKANQEELQALRKKLEELKRAKTAHELNKAKRDHAKQEKAKAAAAAAAAEQGDLPPCFVCSKATDPDDFYHCPACRIYAVHGVIKEPVVFCSRECNTRGKEAHVKEVHPCAYGRDCVVQTDEDVDMESGGRVPVFCRECLEVLKIPTLVCSARCYDSHFQRHRDGVHLLERQKQGKTVEDENQLEFASEDRSRYHARKIEEHFTPFPDALLAMQQRTGETRLS
ncbi:hypothetical protein F4780DRAFT_779301 [Xylariomycetidae sp. FL0641]|nr:hypothetical protein F4780DRAFT_779301 [Xylariomycetidae sp. FL0641]